jgi:hypothetical protein
MKRVVTVLAILAVAGLSSSAFARGGGHGGGRVSYGGGVHTSSHGGHYSGGVGSSHRGGSYVNPNTGNAYGTHK